MQGTVVGLFSSVTFKMKTEYQISGSTSVTSRENGAVHEMVMDESLMVVSTSPTDDRRPGRKIIMYTEDFQPIVRI